MTKIKVMDTALANKIAAGEVIEKTSSVVKELVENSIDAKAKIIKINLVDGGLKEITVIDDGLGMDEEDASLCFMPHATSKIKTTEDLFFIGTLGFRGEALPSIASVSEVLLITSTGNIGTKIHIKGGEVLLKEKSDARCGTLITVTNLFYNTPARLKFLKNESSELINTTKLISKLSLANPSISFTLTNNDKTIIKTSGSDNLLKTIHEIYGLNISSNMLYLNIQNDDFIVTGFISKPTILKTNRNDLITFVNDRVVRNIDINKAINDAYYTYKPSDRYPVVILNIETDPTLMDVNIHPTKQDIKLSKMEDLYELIYKGIKDLLYSNILIPEVKREITQEENIFPNYNKEEIVNNQEKKADIEEEIIQTTLDFNVDNFKKQNEEVKSLENVIYENKEIKKLVLYPIGLVHGTYIVAENEDGMYLIDQHAAAERINYEKILIGLKEKKVNIKTMLIPVTIELSKSDYLSFSDKKEQFLDLGFTYEDFGIDTISVKSHPDFLLHGYEEESIRKIIELIINLDKNFDRVKFEEKIAITLSCKMSIKGNTKSSITEMEYFLEELVKCDNPYNCPHGRPTIITYTTYELEKLFKRAI